MLKIYDVSLRVVRELQPFFGALRGCDRELWDQGRRAASSVTLNIAEGSGVRGGRRRNHYEIALGSARELRAVVDSSVAAGYTAPVSAQALDDLERIKATLINLVR
jgi:four helix bundle protein